MSRNIHPNQITLFDSAQDRGQITRERERERRRLRHDYNDIISVDNLLCSWQEFLVGKKRRKDVEEFSLNLTDNILELNADLAKKAYHHSSYFAFKINDPKPRDIHKAAVRDRLLHNAIYRILYPYYDKLFIHDSYSCRNNKGTHRAINKFRVFSRKVSANNTQTAWVLKCDVRKFFANIDHEILKDILRRNISDPDILELLGKIIKSFHSENGQGKGLPLGNLTSQLLANVYMNEFDQFMKRELKIKYYIRYADDFVILSDNKDYLVALIPKIQGFLGIKLRLSLHPDKTAIQTLASGVDFLGYVVFPNHKILRTKTKRRMQRKINETNQASYLGLLSHCNNYELERLVRKSLEKH